MHDSKISGAMVAAAAMVAILLLPNSAWARRTVQAGAGGTLPPIELGEEVKVEDPKTGSMGYYQLFIPRNYTPDRAWPVIISYHGLTASPTTWPFKDLVDRKHYIIIGMGYHQQGHPGYEYYKTKDVEILDYIMTVVGRQYKIDQRRVIAGGFSKGGFYSGAMMNLQPRRWMAAAILGSGAHGEPPTDAVRGKAIFIGCGADDEAHIGSARKSIADYKLAGAALYEEIWPGVAHKMNTRSGKLKEWLMLLGPLATLKSDMATAASLEAAKPGKAYLIYTSISEISNTNPSCTAAAGKAAAIAQKAQGDLDAAAQEVQAQRYAQAVTILTRIQTRFDGTVFAQTAAKSMAEIRSNPVAAGAIQKAELEEKASQLETQAKVAEKEKNFRQAILLYERYASQCSGADNYAAVVQRLEALKSDKAIASDMADKEAAAKCVGWLSMATNYIGAGKPQAAVPYLKKVIEQYGQSKYAQEARILLAQIESAKE